MEKDHLEQLRIEAEQAKIQNEKLRAKETKKLYKKLKLDENASKEEINKKMLSYAKSGGELAWYHISDEQKNDANFMLCLHKIDDRKNIGYIKHSDLLAQNVDFMVQYCRIKFDRDMRYYKKTGYCEPSVGGIVKDYDFKKVNKNPEFYVALIKEFPDCNILKVVDDVRCGVRFSLKEKEVDSICQQIPKETFVEQAKKYGTQFLRYLPTSHPDYVEFVGYGIECDGFKSLNYLPKKDILSNKDLIIKAFDKDGATELKHYFNRGISPNREYATYDHCGTYFDTDYVVIQKALIKDKQFWATLKSKMSKEDQKNFSIEWYADSRVVDLLNKLEKVDENQPENGTQKDQGKTK